VIAFGQYGENRLIVIAARSQFDRLAVGNQVKVIGRFTGR